MSQFSSEEIQKKFALLSDDIKKAITSVDTSKSLQSIGEKYKLHIDQIGMLGEETGFVMLGLTHPTKFTSDLKNKLGLDDEIIKKIAEDVNVQIFRPIRESLKKVHSIGEGGEDTSNPQPFSPFQPPSIVRGSAEADALASEASAALATFETGQKNAMQKTEMVTMPKDPNEEAAQSATISRTLDQEKGKEILQPPAVNEKDLPAPPVPKTNETGGVAENDLSRASILHDIENPPASKVVSEKFIENKMAGMVKMPSEEKEIKAPTPPPIPESPNKTYPMDPYREPLK